jgi:putative heme iron utilization protein
MTIQEKLNEFDQNFKSLVISSLTKDGHPFSSYAPFVKYEGNYYAIVSRIAKHFENMLNNEKVSILFLEDEQSASNVFFRKRLSFMSTAKVIEDRHILQSVFHKKFGDFVEMLFQMDFEIVRFEVIEGRFVVGAGQAYHVDNQLNVIEQMKGISSGHGHKKD